MRCATPIKSPDGNQVRCRKCGMCNEFRKAQWVGRCYAETLSSTEVWGITLTYGGGDQNERAIALNYDDVQLFLKRLRRAGHLVRFICVGEYGRLKGRAHWHLIVFWKNGVPDLPQATWDGRVHWDKWPHGHVYVDRKEIDDTEGTLKLVRYLWKYLDNDDKAPVSEPMRCSTRPAIGEVYCIEWAKRHAAQGATLFANGIPMFTVDGIRAQKGPRKGRHWQYWLEKSSALTRRMVDAYVMEWTRLYPDREVPYSELVDDYLQTQVEDVCPTALLWHERLHMAKREERRWIDQTLARLRNPVQIVRTANGLYVCTDVNRRKYLARIEQGAVRWQRNLEKAGEAIAAEEGRLSPLKGPLHDVVVGYLKWPLVRRWRELEKGATQ